MCSKRYRNKDHVSTSRRNQDHAGRCVFPDDAEDIKAHKWFREIPWDRIHTMTPPFVPNIKSMDDTHYFDEEESISDFSASITHAQPTPDNLAGALKNFDKELQIVATGYIERPYDSIKLRNLEKEIDAFDVPDEQKTHLKDFVKRFGHKERKRPRDRLLRDRALAPKVLELRKGCAFLGYTYRRIQCKKLANGKAGGAELGGRVSTSNLGMRNAWHPTRPSIV